MGNSKWKVFKVKAPDVDNEIFIAKDYGHCEQEVFRIFKDWSKFEIQKIEFLGDLENDDLIKNK